MKREEKNKLTREKILKAAIDEFGKNDYAVASTNEMCKNYGISKGLLFHHFNSKDELFLKCIESAYDNLLTYIKVNYKKTSEGFEMNINQYFEVRQKFFLEYPEYSRLFKSAIINTPTNLKNEIKILKEPLKELNRSILSDLLADETLNDGLTDNQVIELIINFFEYLLIAQPDMEEQEIEQQMVRFIKMIFWGIVKREGEIE